MTNTTNTHADRQAHATPHTSTVAAGRPATANRLLATKPVSTGAAHAARIAIVSGTLFAVLLLGLHVLEPEFDPTWRFVSEYMLGPYGWVMHLAFGALATSIASVGVAIVSQIRTWPGYVGLALLGLAAIGILITALFTTDLATTKLEALTFRGTMHVLGVSLDYTPVAALLLSWSLARNEAWQAIRGRLFLAAGIMFVIMVGLIAVLPYDGTVGPGVLAGLVGRFLLLSYLGWIVIVGRHAIALHTQTQTAR